MCFSKLFKKKEEILDGSRAVLNRRYFLDLLKPMGIDPLTDKKPLDTLVFLASKSDLDKVAPHLVYPSEWYINDLWDCDDYGLQAQLDAGRNYETTVRLGLGMLDNDELDVHGYHGFAMTLDIDHNLWLLEPNAVFPWAGEWFVQGEHGYICDQVFI